MKNFLNKLVRNFLEVFAWPNIIWHFLMVGLTFVIVISGFDWHYYVSTRGIAGWVWMPSAIVGGLLPIFLPLTLFGFGRFAGNQKATILGMAVAQAAILGSFISSIYKAFTGRIPPDFSDASIDISREFNFGFWENGIFWGWPSSHTTIAFAMAITLIYLFPQSKALRYVALAYALYIGFGASIGFHWFSEFASGIILGSLIGVVVGRRHLSEKTH
jgi:membrane-associated phospholipid phosphatase